MTAWVQIAASVIGFLVGKGLDRIVGRWFAAVTIAWEKVASASARKAFTEAFDEMKAKVPGKSDQWDEWRRIHGGKP